MDRRKQRERDKKVFWKLQYYVRDPSITHDANNTDKYTPTQIDNTDRSVQHMKAYT